MNAQERRDSIRTRIVTLGAASSANKGAAAMLQSVTENLPRALGPCHFDVLTTYPTEDRMQPPRVPSESTATIVSCRPRELVFPLLPLALTTSAARGLGLDGAMLGITPAMESILQADIVIDLAGISFSDGRGVALLAYNTLMTGIPVLAGSTVIKAAQALGPFDEPLNRFVARALLPRLGAVIARGEITQRQLNDLGLDNVHRAADLAYALRTGPQAEAAADRLLDRLVGGGPFTALVPSNVVRMKCERLRIPYFQTTVDFIRRLAANGRRVLIIPHAARPRHGESHMNDLPLCRAISEAVGSAKCKLLDDSLRPEVLRVLVDRAEILVTARYHALISALATATPALVIGWSHKYTEALGEFDLDEWKIDYRNLEVTSLHEEFVRLSDRKDAVQSKIRARLLEVRRNAERNFEIIREIFESRGGKL